MTDNFGGDADGQSNHLEKLFRVWRDLELRIKSEALSSASQTQASADRRAAQKVLVDTAALMRAANDRDLLFKLAFWRWLKRDLANSLDEMNESDAIVYSAFRDLAELTGETIVRTETDEKTNLLRLPLD